MIFGSNVSLFHSSSLMCQDDGDGVSVAADASVNIAGNQKRRSDGAWSSTQASPSETKKFYTSQYAHIHIVIHVITACNND